MHQNCEKVRTTNLKTYDLKSEPDQSREVKFVT